MIAISPLLIYSKNSCLEEVNEEDRAERIKHAISQCTSSMINMVFVCNGRPIHSVDIVAVKAMYGMEIIEKKKTRNVDSEDMVMNFLSNVELFHTKMIL